MSAPSQTKIFGLNLGVDPKYILGGLLVVAALVWFFNSRSGGSSESTATTNGAGADGHAFSVLTNPNTPQAKRVTRRRDRQAFSDRGTLKIAPVDATHGDIDPTLRLDLLERLHNVESFTPGRSLFEVGPAAPTIEEVQRLNKRINPAPIAAPPPAVATTPTTPQMNLPLHFYGYENAASKGQVKRGLFMDGDNIIVAKEGDLVLDRYRLVQLTPTTARLVDTQISNLSQTLTVTPEAMQP